MPRAKTIHPAAALTLSLLTLASAGLTRAQDRPILVGPVTRADLQTSPYAEWFDGQYSRYQPAASIVESLRPRLAAVKVEAYFGTWCGDSRRQIPRLMRLLDMEGFDEARLSLIALSDRPMEFKQAPGHPEAKRQVHRTPTIIVLKDGAEVGRIVETPATSLEGDLLAILEGHGPEPKYGAEAWVHHLFVDLKADDAIEALKTAGPEVTKRGEPGSLSHYAEFDLLKNGRAREA
ncbi:MAG: thioredoxin family protein, partial [Vicinamibacteria bacterium]